MNNKSKKFLAVFMAVLCIAGSITGCTLKKKDVSAVNENVESSDNTKEDKQNKNSAKKEEKEDKNDKQDKKSESKENVLKSTDNFLKLSFPSDWTESKEDETGSTKLFVENKNEDAGCIVEITESSGISLEQMSEGIKKVLKDRESSVKTSKDTETTINGNDAVQFETTMSKSGMNLTYFTTVLKVDDKFCIIHFYTLTESYDKYLKEFKTIVKTAEF